MKLKVLKLLLAFGCFSLVMGNTPTYAKEESENTTESTTIEQVDGPFVDALPVPDDAIEFLKERKMDIIHLEDIDDIETADIFFGEAFSMHNYTQPQEYKANEFPIFNHDTCIAVVGIYKGSRGQYTWTTIHGGEFCEKVTEVARQKGNFRLGETKEHEMEVIEHSNPIDGIGQASILTPVCTISVEELKQKQIADSLTERTGNYPYSKTLPMNPKEKQTTLPWCAAYAAGQLVSFLMNCLKIFVPGI